MQMSQDSARRDLESLLYTIYFITYTIYFILYTIYYILYYTILILILHALLILYLYYTYTEKLASSKPQTSVRDARFSQVAGPVMLGWQ